MIFNVNDTLIEGELSNADITTIKSYNKNYNVIYYQDTLYELIRKIYNIHDLIIIDENVFLLYKDHLKDIDDKYMYVFKAIEDNKNIASVLQITDTLYNLQITKKNKLIIIGGGITQDVSGFVSGIYKRGIKWIFIPTTLLSMTDSAIGGKVSLNTMSKNILGLFVSPNNIYISKTFLKTLNNDDMTSGIGEALKLSLIGGKESYKYFKENIKIKNYINLIKISICIKKVIIEKDEFDENERKVLNYGHTIGHALEITSNYFIPHGIAVLFGMFMINKLFYNDKYEEINNFIIEMIPEKFKKIKLSYDELLKHISSDKKNNGDNICFILLDDIGKSIFVYKKLDDISDKLKIIFSSLFTINE